LLTYCLGFLFFDELAGFISLDAHYDFTDSFSVFLPLNVIEGGHVLPLDPHMEYDEVAEEAESHKVKEHCDPQHP